jgi:vacuolar-type H+-ATPase subunit H
MEQWLLVALYVAVTVVAFVGGYVLSRRIQRVETPSEALAEARLEAQRILARAEEEARTKAEVYRDREDATLEHRRLEMGSQEARRPSNSAQATSPRVRSLYSPVSKGPPTPSPKPRR